MSDNGQRQRPAAIYLSRRDQEALEEGYTPSWEETADVSETTASAQGPQDHRLLRDKPPHW
ncbi:MAG: hypothetical protein Q4B10_07200 [Actinomycetaceae bacterium]|nr:hypothetical protein [Actinomycetaceae bacterium]